MIAFHDTSTKFRLGRLYCFELKCSNKIRKSTNTFHGTRIFRLNVPHQTRAKTRFAKFGRPSCRILEMRSKLENLKRNGLVFLRNKNKLVFARKQLTNRFVSIVVRDVHDDRPVPNNDWTVTVPRMTTALETRFARRLCTVYYGRRESVCSRHVLPFPPRRRRRLGVTRTVSTRLIAYKILVLVVFFPFPFFSFCFIS